MKLNFSKTIEDHEEARNSVLLKTLKNYFFLNIHYIKIKRERERPVLLNSSSREY